MLTQDYEKNFVFHQQQAGACVAASAAAADQSGKLLSWFVKAKL